MDLQLFASFHTMLGKHINADVSDIVSTIFHYYKGTYENYTLLELINLMYNLENDVQFAWNKKEIIQIIQERHLPIPPKNLDEPMEYSIWKHYRLRRSLDLVCVEKYNLHFQEGDIIKMPDNLLYSIDAIRNQQNIVYIYLLDMETTDETYYMTADSFFKMLDEEDITIMQNLQSSYYMNEEQENYYLSEQAQRWI